MFVRRGSLARFGSGRVRPTEHVEPTTLVPLVRPARLDVLHDGPAELGQETLDKQVRLARPQHARRL